MKKVSVITINFNNKSGLEKTVRSVLSQEYKDYEYIIIDGGSVDGSKELIMSYSDYLSYWVSEPDSGIYNAMNKALDICNGEWVFFLNSGDVFASNNVLCGIDFDVGNNVGAIYGLNKYYTRNNRLLLNEALLPFWESRKKYRSMGFSHQAVFVRTTIAKRFGFDESYKLCADYNMIMQIYKNNYLFLRSEIIISICDGRGGASYNNRYLQDMESARVCGCEHDFFVVFRIYVTNIFRPIYRYINKKLNL